MQSLFGEALFTVRLFCTILATERAFHTVSHIKDHLSSAVCRDRLNSLTILSLQSEVARKFNFNDIIDYFARMEA